MLFKLIGMLLIASTIVVGVYFYIQAAALEREIAAESAAPEDDDAPEDEAPGSDAEQEGEHPSNALTTDET